MNGNTPLSLDQVIQNINNIAQYMGRLVNDLEGGSAQLWQPYSALLTSISALTVAAGSLVVGSGSQTVTALAPGTSGYYLKSQGTGNALVWANNAGIEQIGATLTPTGATASFTSISAQFSALALYWTGLSSDTATRALQIQVSTNNGVSYDTTAANYPGKDISGTTVNAKASASLIENVNGAAANTNTGSLLIRPYQGGPLAMYTGYYLDPAGTIHWSQGAYLSTSAINAIQANWSGSGNFDAGTISLWGIH